MKRFVIVLSTMALYSADAVGQSYGDYAVTVDVTGNGFAHYTTVYFDDESWDPQNPPTFGWDACCDALMIWANTNQPHVFTEVVEPPLPPNNHRLSVNGLPPINQHTEVPLGFLPGELAPYVFTFKELYTLPTGMGVELEDLSLNVTQDLLVDSTYDTWGAPSDDEQRFMLHFYPQTITGVNLDRVDQQIDVTTNENSVYVRVNGNDRIETVTILSMNGSVVFQQRRVGDNTLIWSKNEHAPGIYVVQVSTHEGVETARRVSF